MTEAEIIHTQQQDSGRYFMKLSHDLEAEMTYRRVNDHTISIDHTYVPPSERGKNIAEKLMQYAIKQATEQHDKIIPQCSYVATQFRRHPQWAALLAKTSG